jgi:hypothetical protein
MYYLRLFIYQAKSSLSIKLSIFWIKKMVITEKREDIRIGKEGKG